MNKMNKNMIIDCSEQLSTDVSRIEECERELRELIGIMSENNCGDELECMVNTIQKEIEEQAVRVRRLSFVLMSAADVVDDNDKKSLQVCTGEANLSNNLSRSIIGSGSETSALNQLPSSLLKINV